MATRAKDDVGANNQPFISVVVSVFNSGATLQQCIDSLSKQTYSAWELIVIDGGSKDCTPQILQRNSAQLSYWVSEPDRGIYHAWNKGLLRARGEWICFLGADDYLWSPNVLERIAPVLTKAYPPSRIVYGQVAVVNLEGEEISRAGVDWQTARKRLQQIMCLPHTGLMHHRSVFDTHGRFDESFRIGGDYEMLLRELLQGDAVFISNLVVAGMRHGGVSSDPAGSLRMLREFRRAQRMHGLRKPGWHWLAAYARAQLRVWLWRMLGSRLGAYVFDFARLISGKKPYWTRL